MKLKTYIVDAFTDEPFKGNPAGVCLPEDQIEESHMQSIAKELNLSETAFLRKSEKYNTYQVRYFSPKMEIPFCGHATLAASKVLFNISGLSEIKMVTLNGLTLRSKNVGDKIEMVFPVYESSHCEMPPKQMLHALGLDKVVTAKYAEVPKMMLLEIPSTQQLFNLQPNFRKLLASIDSINGVIVTSKSEDKKYDFYSRYFWPWVGSNEDPVTGAAHSVLSKYWAGKLDKTSLKAFQASDRGGYLNLELMNNGSSLKVVSNAVVVMEGAITII